MIIITEKQKIKYISVKEGLKIAKEIMRKNPKTMELLGGKPMKEKQKTCLGFWKEDVNCIKQIADYDYYTVKEFSIFPAVPKSEFEAILKEGADYALRLNDANKAYDKLKEDKKAWENSYNELHDIWKELELNSIPKEKVRKVLEDELKDANNHVQRKRDYFENRSFWTGYRLAVRTIKKKLKMGRNLK